MAPAITGPMTLPQVETKLIEPRILAKFFRPKYSPTVDQFTGNVDSTTLKSAMKIKIAHSECTRASTHMETKAKSMHVAISLGLERRSPIQPKSRCEGTDINAWAARK